MGALACSPASSLEAPPEAGPCEDKDLDGFCLDVDCDDNESTVHPEAIEEVCNGLDDDCDPTSPEAPDEDGDGLSLCEEDCDDNPLAGPQWDEVCEEAGDEDCDGEEGCAVRDCEDKSACAATCGDGLVEDAEECDDGGTLTGDGCSADCRLEQSPEEAFGLIDAPGATGEGFLDSSLATNGVRGGGAGSGSMDVFSLGFTEGQDNYLVLNWPGMEVLNGPGTDLVVFENPFFLDEAQSLAFMDPAIVYFSQDGESWVPYPYDYLALDESQYSSAIADWQGFAGIQPVLFHEEDNPVDPFDTEAAGGDPFDLDTLPLDGGAAEAIRVYGFSHLMIVTAPTVINDDTGEFFVHDLVSNGADIDGVYARYLVSQ